MISSPRALEDLGLDPEEVNSDKFRRIVSGQFYINNEKLIDRSCNFPFPYAQAYAGWQFGQFAGQLGDGRVTNLFEVEKPTSNSSANRNKYEIQLKGSGKTPFARFADGKAIIGSSIREYLISEHLNALKIPTTRALSLTYLPKTYAQRSEGAKRCAIVARFAELWVRLGTFDLYRWRGDRDGIKQLSDYVIEELFTVEGEKFSHFNALMSAKNDFFQGSSTSIGTLTDYDKMYYETTIRNAITAAQWQAYGFLNGVLNTDNTSILGLSLDFGPFEIFDKFYPNFTPNTSDHERRYSYKNTPTVIWWNLTRLGEDLAELIGAGKDLLQDPEFKNGTVKPEWEKKIISRATKVIEVAGEVYKYALTKQYVESFFGRLGIEKSKVDVKNPDVQNLEIILSLLSILLKVQCDFNKFFLVLQNSELDAKIVAEKLFAVDESEEFSSILKEEFIVEFEKWLTVLKPFVENDANRRLIASEHNPLFLPRTWILQEVIDEIEELKGEDLGKLKKLQKMTIYPFDRSKWGDEMKELENKWLVQGEKMSMMQCGGCS